MRKWLAILLSAAMMLSTAGSVLAEEPSGAAASVEGEAAEEAGAGVSGEFSGTAMGLGGDVEVTVTLDNGVIVELTAVGEGETKGIGSVALEELPPLMVEGNTVNVDALSGATVTSNAILAAAKAALEAAGLNPDDYMVKAEAEEAETEEAAPAEGVSGEFSGTAAGLGGDVEVTVTLENGVIADVKAVGEGETQGIGSVALEELPPLMVEGNTVNVDAMSGATVTSNAILAAAKAALEAAGVNPDDYMEKAEAAEAAPAEDVTVDTDVVIIGAGGAGMTAAIVASDAGKKVVVVESQPMVGGNSVRSTGGMNASETPYEEENEFGEEAGVEKTLATAREKWADNETIQALADTVEEQWEAYKAAADPDDYFDTAELFELDTMIGGSGKNDPELVKALVENSDEAIEWLGSIGAELHNVSSFGGASVKRIHRPVNEEGKVVSVGAYVIPILQSNMEERGVELMLNTTATKILMEDGKAVGIEAEAKDGSKVTVNAGAVIIASGGFGANNDMIKELNPVLDGYISTNASGILGQGIVMGQEAGADVVDMDQIQLHPTVHVAEDGSANLITEGLRGDGAILVNQEGKRFYDEVSTRDKVSDAENQQTGGFAWLIVDQKMYDASAVIQGYISKNWAVTGESAEELAEAMGVDPAALAETIETWNSYVEAKEDPEFGRTSFANILEAPFYALTVQPGVHHTMGGLKINANTEVIDTEGNVIPGLFAAGEVTGGVHGGNRLGGNAVADFVVFGRMAGTNAAAYTGGEEAAPEEAAEEAAPAEGVSGEFTGTAAGLGGDVDVTVTLENGVITDVKAVGEGETQGIGSVALEELPPLMVEGNTVNVDAMSGATVTSNAILAAAKAALEAAGVNPDDYMEKAEAEEAAPAEDVTVDTDVVIIGAGGAGMTAAIVASDAGKKVVVVESQPMVGGNSVRSTGGMNASETPYEEENEFGEEAGVEKMLATAREKWADNETIQSLADLVEAEWKEYQEAGNPDDYFDSATLFALDTMIGGNGINDPLLVSALVENSDEGIAWLDSIGAELHNVSSFGGASVKRIHRPVNEEGKVVSVGAYVIPILQSNMEERGVDLMLNTTATKILMEDGQAVGIEAEAKDGSKVTVNAGAVIIASGGFGANNDMIKELNPVLDGYISTNASGILGQGIVMGQEAGADVVDMDQIQLHPTVHVAEDGSANLITEGLRGDGAILVNQEGKRFYDEVSTRDKVSDAENQQTGGFAWLIVDQKMYDASAVIQGYISKNWAVTGESAEELAEAMGVDPTALAETIETWNSYVEAKEDPEFGRTSFANILEAPFYALTVQPGVHHTMGGLKINANTEVIDTEGNVIPGLFAAGEVTGGVHGGNRLGGNAVADFVVFGHKAGEMAAAYTE